MSYECGNCGSMVLYGKCSSCVDNAQNTNKHGQGESSLEYFAKSGLLPTIVSENGEDGEPITEVIVCSSISGGGQYISNMPKGLSLQRKLSDGTEFDAKYINDLFYKDISDRFKESNSFYRGVVDDMECIENELSLIKSKWWFRAISFFGKK